MNIVILAAGMGKRMHSVLPKVLQPLAGRPMLEHVLEATSGFSSSPRVVVVGHRAEDVKARFGGRDDVTFALQEPQLGTGHALTFEIFFPNITVRQCLNFFLHDEEFCIISRIL